MKVLVDIEFGIIAENFRSACETAKMMGLPKSGWFHATPEALLGRSNALIIEGKGAAKYPRRAEVDHRRAGCDFARDDRIARVMQATVRAMLMGCRMPPDVPQLGGLESIGVAAPRGRLARLQKRLSAAWAELRS
jgi:hypothetical protein